jgi:hypothetical protein
VNCIAGLAAIAVIGMTITRQRTGDAVLGDIRLCEGTPGSGVESRGGTDSSRRFCHLPVSKIALFFDDVDFSETVS